MCEHLQEALVKFFFDNSPLFAASIVSIVSVAAGALCNNWGAKNQRKSEHKDLQKNLRYAFSCEINAIVELIKKRDYLQGVKDSFVYFHTAIENGRTLECNQTESFITSNFDDYFHVYRSNVGQLGMLAPQTSKKIVQFYIQIFSLLEDATQAPGTILRNAQRNNSKESDICYTYALAMRDLFAHDAQLLQETIELGEEICKLLDQDS